MAAGVLTRSLLMTVRVSPGAPVMAGTLIGIYTYILKFVNGLDTIPYMVQRVTSLRDIMQRIELEAEETNLPDDKGGRLLLRNPNTESFGQPA